MKKIIFRTLLTFFLIIFISIFYLSLIGLETSKFNDQIEKKITNFSKDLEVELKEVKLVLDPLKFQFNTKTLGPKINFKNQIFELESIQTQVSLNSIFKDSFPLKNLDISTKTLEVKKLISLIRSIKKDPKLFILENFIKKGYILADIKIEFDEDGNIKNNYKINGFIKDGKIDFLKDYRFEKINFNFQIGKEISNFQEITFLYKGLNLSLERLTTKNIENEFYIDGKIINKNLIVKENFFEEFFEDSKIKIQKVDLDSENTFSFKLDKKFKIENFKLKSKIKFNEAKILNNFDLENFFPQMNKQINLINHNIEIDYFKNEFRCRGSGSILLQKNNDQIEYTILKKDKKIYFNTSLIIDENEFSIDFLNYKKNDKTKLKVQLKGDKDQNGSFKLDILNLKSKDDEIELKNTLFDKNFKIVEFSQVRFNYIDQENQINRFKIIKNQKNYILNGDHFNASYLLDSLSSSDDEEKLSIFKKKISLKIKIKNIRLDEEYNIRNLKGNLVLLNDDIISGDLDAFFSDKDKVKFTTISKNNEKITTLFSDIAKPFVKKYKFIKGFSNGTLDFYSIKKNNKTDSNLKIYDFKLKEVPALTKLLTLASLQGIADLLSGEGIRFNEFEMKFFNEPSLMTVSEIYAIGPAISILMDGYIEKNKLVSLRGTLVPATTINKAIGSIPILGQILVGSKTGEGVFGVSFKIKGPPKKLETTVNPIKTLTPRFITRTLEKIKKN